MSTPYAFTHANLVTADEVGTVRPDHTVVVDASGRISAVGPSTEVDVPTEYSKIDCTGRYVIPGLINAHAHLFADGKPLGAIYLHPRMKHLTTNVMRSRLGRQLMRTRTRTNARTQLHSGVTTLRTVGDVADEVIEYQDAVDRGELCGPRVLASGPLMAITGGHGHPQIAHLADTPEQGRAGTRTNLTRGARAIKIAATGGVTDAKGIGHAGTPEVTEETMRAICEEAHAAGVLVAAHAQSVEGVRRALRAGVDTIEHGSEMDDETIELFKENPRSLRGWSALVPTIQAALPLVKLDRAITGIDEVVHSNAELVLDAMFSGIRSALDNDIPLGMGTDSAVTYVTHANTWRELDYLVRYGKLTPTQALTAATRTNARILGLSAETGSLEVGKSADLVVLDENPLESLRALRSPRAVLVRGHLIEDPQIDRIAGIDAHLDTL